MQFPREKLAALSICAFVTLAIGCPVVGRLMITWRDSIVRTFNDWPTCISRFKKRTIGKDRSMKMNSRLSSENSAPES